MAERRANGAHRCQTDEDSSDLAGKLTVWCCLTHRYEKRRSANKLISELAAANSYAS